MQETDIDTILGDDLKFRGKLHFKKNLKINGHFNGQITTDGHLIIGPSADVEADVETGTISIEGEMRGNIVAKKRVELLKSARLHGDIRTPDLKIESGTRFSGSCVMD